ncbi:MAG: hypothetical protein IPK14_28270 [Blastocatellia bacterium]|nr:hypothetical protein [Blastocatellia bacterium]
MLQNAQKDRACCVACWSSVSGVGLLFYLVVGNKHSYCAAQVTFGACFSAAANSVID